MAITADNIRALSGLSSAELPDSLIAASLVLDRVELDRETYFTTTIDIDDATTLEDKSEAMVQHDYRVWKAIDYLAPGIRTSIPETIKDNFNQFTRFGTFEKMLDFAASYVTQTEKGVGTVDSLLSIFTPASDPVTQES